MAEEQEWIQRRQRMVKCKIHGLHYDPEMSSGCTRCLKEAAKALPQRSPRFAIILICLLGIAVILYQIFGPDQGGDASPAPVAEADVDTSRLDPEPYRQPIEAIESALFAPIDTLQDLTRTGGSFPRLVRNLSESVQRREPEAGATVTEVVDRLGEDVAADGFSFADLERVRADWLRFRQRHLRPAPWFTEVAAGAPKGARIIVVEHRVMAESLLALLQEGAAQAQVYSDDVGREGADAGSDDRQGIMGDWTRRLEELQQRRPGRPGAGTDERILLAVQELERALQQARALTGSSSSDSSRRFNAAVVQAEKAVRAFEDIEV